MTNQQIAEALRLKFNIKGNMNDDELIKRFIPSGLSEHELSLIKERSSSLEQMMKALELYFDSK